LHKLAGNTQIHEQLKKVGAKIQKLKLYNLVVFFIVVAERQFFIILPNYKKT